MKQILLILGIFAVGCNNSFLLDKLDEVTPQNPIDSAATFSNTSWKLAGFMNVAAGTLTEAEPKDCEECFTLSFETDSTFTGKSSTNELYGEYALDYQTSTIQIINLGGTKIGETPDGYKYMDSLRAIHSFSITETALKLYYNNGKEYLLYVKAGESNIGTANLQGTAHVLTGSAPSELQQEMNIMYIIYDKITHSATFSVSFPQAEYVGDIINFSEFAEGLEIPDEGIEIDYTGILYQKGMYLSMPPLIGGSLVLTACKNKNIKSNNYLQ
jgi:hypothetical protein